MSAHVRNKLKDLTVQKLMRQGTPGVHGDGGGLYLRVSSPTRASWVYRWFDGKPHEIGLGKARDVPLQRARAKAQELRELRSDGGDPRAEKQASALAKAQQRASQISFADAADQFWRTRKAGWRSADHTDAWITSMKSYILPHVGAMPIAEITTADLVRCLRPDWATKFETLKRVRARTEAVFSYAVAHGMRADNPASWAIMKHMLPTPVRSVKHHEAMALQDLPPFMAELRACDEQECKMLEVLVLTCMRSKELRSLHVSDVDLERRMILIPGERMKGGRPHRIPMSDRVADILKETRPVNGLVFPGPDGKVRGEMVMTRLLRRMGRTEAPHGFRSSFRDWAAERGVPRELAELCLAHRVGDEVERAYQRSDLVERRRQVMRDWEAAATSAA